MRPWEPKESEPIKQESPNFFHSFMSMSFIIPASYVTVDQKQKKRIEHLCGPQSTRELLTQETTQDVNAERRR